MNLLHASRLTPHVPFGRREAWCGVRDARAHGFTLLELLLAIAVFAVVLAAINGVFYGALRLRNRTNEAIERGLPVQQALAILRRDLAGLVLPGTGLAGALNSSAVIVGINQQEVGTEFFTTSGVPEGDTPWADLQKVAYVLRDPTNRTSFNGRDLVRVVRRNLLPSSFVEPAFEQRLLSDVERLEWSFYDGTSWRTYWDSTNETTLVPRAIRVEIAVAEPLEDQPAGRVLNPRTRTPIQLVMPVVVRPSTNTTSQAEGGDQ